MSVKYVSIILFTLVLLINIACSPERDIVEKDIYGCYPPMAGVYTSNNIDLSLAETVLEDISIGAFKIQNSSEVISLLNEAAQNQSVREYYHCLAKNRDRWNNEQIAWLDRIIIFTQSNPTSDQLAKFLDDNHFPNSVNNIQKIIIKGEIRDNRSNELITNKQIQITIDSNDFEAFSDSNGQFSGTINSKYEKSIILRAFHPDYKSVRLSRIIDSKILQFNIFMELKTD